MKQPLNCAILLLALICVLGWATSLLPVRAPEIRIERLAAEAAAETKLALGRKVRLSRADQYDLELIPGISTVFALKILAAKDRLLSREGCDQAASEKGVFTSIHGVGAKTSAKFERYIDAALSVCP